MMRPWRPAKRRHSFEEEDGKKGGVEKRKGGSISSQEWVWTGGKRKSHAKSHCSQIEAREKEGGEP